MGSVSVGHFLAFPATPCLHLPTEREPRQRDLCWDCWPKNLKVLLSFTVVSLTISESPRCDPGRMLRSEDGESQWV